MDLQSFVLGAVAVTAASQVWSIVSAVRENRDGNSGRHRPLKEFADMWRRPPPETGIEMLRATVAGHSVMLKEHATLIDELAVFQEKPIPSTEAYGIRMVDAIEMSQKYAAQAVVGAKDVIS